MLAAAIAVEAAAVALFGAAGSVPVLLIARVVQGIATGLALPALGATLVDLNPPHAPGRAAAVNAAVPVGGLAAGALGSSALVQFAPDPTRLVWALLLGALLLAFPALLMLPRTAARRGGIARSLTPRIGVPRRLRGDVGALVPLIVASWALGGLYLSLGPSVVLHVFGVPSHFLGGLVVTVLCGTGAVTALALRGRPARAVARAAAGMLAAGTAITMLGMVTGSVPAALAGTVAAGIGYGASGLATFGTLADLADRPGRGVRARRAVRVRLHRRLPRPQPAGRGRWLCRDGGGAARHGDRLRAAGHRDRAGGAVPPGGSRRAPGPTGDLADNAIVDEQIAGR